MPAEIIPLDDLINNSPSRLMHRIARVCSSIWVFVCSMVGSACSCSVLLVWFPNLKSSKNMLFFFQEFLLAAHVKINSKKIIYWRFSSFLSLPSSLYLSLSIFLSLSFSLFTLPTSLPIWTFTFPPSFGWLCFWFFFGQREYIRFASKAQAFQEHYGFYYRTYSIG